MKTFAIIVALLLLSGCVCSKPQTMGSAPGDDCRPCFQSRKLFGLIETNPNANCGQPVYQAPQCFGDGFKNWLDNLHESIFHCNPPLAAAQRPCVPEPVYRSPCD